MLDRFFECARLCRLDGITYWVIEDPDLIYDFINTEIRREWESDAKFERRDPQRDPWLKTLSKRKWTLEITQLSQIKLNPAIMNYADPKRSYNFQKGLAKRSLELQQSIKEYYLIIWPLITRKEDSTLVDGYCRHAALKALNTPRTYTYVGAM